MSKLTKRITPNWRRNFLAKVALVGTLLPLTIGFDASEANPSRSPANDPAVIAMDDPALDRDGEGGELTIGMSAGNIPYPNTRPNEGYEGLRFVGYQIHEGLTVFNLDQGEEVPSPQPGLAESWEVSDDGLTWIFNLREGVVFHDGTPFNSDAVITAFDRVTNRESEVFDEKMFAATRANTAFISNYRAIDEFTIEIKTEVPYAFLPWDLAFVLIPSPKAVEQYGGDEYINHASGTGPFKMTEYIDGEVLELTPFEDYWREKPKLDKMILRPFPEPASRLAALQAGDIDWAEVPPPDALQLLQDQDYTVLMKPYPHTIILSLDLFEPPFDDVRVRQALQYAINRESMCQDLLNNVCVPAYQYLYEGHPWYSDEFGTKYEMDLEKAKSLLAEAGYEDGLKISIAYPTGGSGNMWPGPMMEFLQSNFREIGVEMEIVPLEWNIIINMLRQGLEVPEFSQYDGFYISLAPLTPPNLAYFTSERIPPNGCCNSGGYINPKADEYYAAARSSFDQEEQDVFMRQYMEVVSEDSPYLYVVHDLNLRVMDPSVRGFVQPRSWFADFRSIWIKE